MAERRQEAVNLEKLRDDLSSWMKRYMKSFYNQNEDIQKMMVIKESHTLCVQAICRELATHLCLPPQEVMLAEISGLLHDIGRFRQFTVYRTFDDARSVDHAELGLSVIEDEKLLHDLPEQEKNAVIFAIRNHNKKEISPTHDRRLLLLARLLRDADKLDIYRVLSPFLTASDGSGVSADFLKKFAAGEQVDYNEIRTLDDRKLVRLMWVYDINFSWTLQRVAAKGYIEEIISCLPPDRAVAEGVQRLQEYMTRKCMMSDFERA